MYGVSPADRLWISVRELAAASARAWVLVWAGSGFQSHRALTTARRVSELSSLVIVQAHWQTVNHHWVGFRVLRSSWRRSARKVPVKVDYGYQEWHNNRSLHTKVPVFASVCWREWRLARGGARRSPEAVGQRYTEILHAFLGSTPSMKCVDRSIYSGGSAT